MKRTITYSLLNGQKHSQQYYRTVSDFADEVLQQIRKRQSGMVDDFMQFIHASERENLRHPDEYSLEVLVLGVLWQTYAPAVVDINTRPYKILSFLTAIRKKSQLLKPLVDWLRGILGALFLKNECHNGPAALDLHTFDRLIEWLAATGDYPDEIKRLRAWRDYLALKPDQEVTLLLDQVMALTEWFDGRSLEVLGVYTPNVDSFLANDHQQHRWMEDRYFTGRPRLEYHMTMVASEVLNRTIHDRFLDCQRHVVILPPCMCNPEDRCQAQLQDFGYLCAHCTPGCRVHQITLLGQKHGFDVLVMPDDLAVFSGGGNSLRSSIGVVGVSCPLTNPGGHWRTREMDVPVQGVLLDYCGCEWHWGLDEHFPTDINLQQLLKVLEK